MCSCYLGYQIALDNRTCTGKHIASNMISILMDIADQVPCAMFQPVDVNECAISNCSQICTNTIGSYMCGCYPGYQISSNNRTCVGKLLTENNQLTYGLMFYKAPPTIPSRYCLHNNTGDNHTLLLLALTSVALFYLVVLYLK